jgi:hypothetical protein
MFKSLKSMESRVALAQAQMGFQARSTGGVFRVVKGKNAQCER